MSLQSQLKTLSLAYKAEEFPPKMPEIETKAFVKS